MVMFLKFKFWHVPFTQNINQCICWTFERWVKKVCVAPVLYGGVCVNIPLWQASHSQAHLSAGLSCLALWRSAISLSVRWWGAVGPLVWFWAMHRTFRVTWSSCSGHFETSGREEVNIISTLRMLALAQSRNILCKYIPLPCNISLTLCLHVVLRFLIHLFCRPISWFIWG